MLIAMLIQAINHGKKRRALEQQRLAAEEQLEATVEVLREAKSELVELKTGKWLDVVVKEEKLAAWRRRAGRRTGSWGPVIDMRSYFWAWREELEEAQERLCVPGWPDCSHMDELSRYDNEDPW